MSEKTRRQDAATPLIINERSLSSMQYVWDNQVYYFSDEDIYLCVTYKGRTIDDLGNSG